MRYYVAARPLGHGGPLLSRWELVLAGTRGGGNERIARVPVAGERRAHLLRGADRKRHGHLDHHDLPRDKVEHLYKCKESHERDIVRRRRWERTHISIMQRDARTPLDELIPVQPCPIRRVVTDLPRVTLPLKLGVLLGDALVFHQLPPKLKTVGESQRQDLRLVTIVERDFEAHVWLP